jgi:hypothetical protein
MELVAYELAEAEAHERKAASHRREAMKLQGSVAAEFRAALAESVERQGLKVSETNSNTRLRS